MNETQNKLHEISIRLVNICNKGALKMPYNFPKNISNSYHRILLDTGNIVGWEDRTKFILNKDKLIERLGLAISLYERSAENIKLIHSEDAIQHLSPVFLIESIIGDEMLDKLACSYVFSAVSVLNLTSFYAFCESFIDEEYFEESYENLIKLCNAQAELLLAQDAINTANKYLYQAKSTIETKVSSDEFNAYLLLEKHEKARRDGGKKSQYIKIYNWAMKEASTRWRKEVEGGLTITRIGIMVTNIKNGYIESFPQDKAASVIPDVKLRDKIRFIAEELAPEALKGGRPKN
ncbi:MAG: hypothetical protein HRT51_11590 [Colwellia sp.]|nr:hypothetical protein [Colwellia sp.]